VLQFGFGLIRSAFLSKKFSFKSAKFWSENSHFVFICKTKILSTNNLSFCKFLAVCQNFVANLHCLLKNCHFLAHLYFLTYDVIVQLLQLYVF